MNASGSRRLAAGTRFAAAFGAIAWLTSAPVGAADDVRFLVRADGGAVTAEACRAGSCRNGSFPLPSDLGLVRVQRFPLEGNRPAAIVEGGGVDGVGRFVVVVTVDDEGEPHEVLRGWVDRPKGEAGRQQTRVLEREPGRGGEALTIGTRFDAVSACGRPVLMQVQSLDVETLEWVPASTRSLSRADRDAATRLFAVRTEASVTDRPRLLVSTVASSALGGSHVGITDGSLERGWIERAPGAGSGEVVAMRSSSAVPIEGFQLVVRGTGDTREVAAPRSLYVVTDRGVVHVTLPEDAARRPEGTVYEVRLPEPQRTECVSLVLDAPYVRGADVVGVAEFRAITALEGKEGFASLVAQLDGPAAQAEGARTLLARSGAAAVRATIGAYASLGATGRARALDVIDSGTCADTAGFHVARLMELAAGASDDPDADARIDAARERVRLCRSEARSALEAVALGDGAEAARRVAFRELAVVAPADAIDRAARTLDGASHALRAALREALASAAAEPRGAQAALGLIQSPGFDTRPLHVRIELLRALVPHVSNAEAVERAFASTFAEGAMRTRYLLLESAASLAQRGSMTATRLLADAIVRDADPRVRARAAEVARGAVALGAPLLRAVEDDSPRVRQAALTSLGSVSVAAATGPIASVLERDRWTFVRVAAAAALSAQVPTRESTRALIGATRDASPLVRRAAIDALGNVSDEAAGDRVHDVAEDAGQEVEVRAAAIATLGRMCRGDSAELLYKLALRTGAPELGYDRPLGLAALAALREIRPPDRRERLMPLVRDGRTPREIKAIVRDAIERTGRCAR